ncbi:phosphatidylinositol-3-phosphatase myotubularin-1 [Phalaenopsis equestris]|uniref:phosphatidylinositol-3-phosphatase myotubularin-1 n=1 Tax=Phalaenopsis equestris TaxID=78828 RepID=UPI0009E5599F|nr:phosphatidylinositol-3-phosphatase myotubularin-1 [Phalaenopsis equestris]XP_020581683.1 phosphatidylinositol-3-phosphatase myotubularin-1 [Phalaenopsis equestris]XP_020581684.1 phosphatidylinositol-3-phosphatase myotubularin-1 [Phalaenopsis equestris]
MDGAVSWDALEWTKNESVSRSATHGMAEFLLEAEEVVAQGHGVVLVNTDQAGTLSVTNFRLLFLSEGSRDIIELGTIALTTIEKFSKQAVKPSSIPRQLDKASSPRLLQVVGKDLRIIVFGFRPKMKQRRAIFDALSRYTKPTRLWDMYTVTCGPSKFSNINPRFRLIKEYLRLLGKGSLSMSSKKIDDGSLIVSNELWRLTTVNSRYSLCSTYPSSLIVPKSISDEELQQAASFRGRGRLPVISWCHAGTGAVLARSSQPLVGLMMNTRSNMDEKLAAALCTQTVHGKGVRRKLYIADARPRKNALANGAMGGGSESSSNYFQSEVVFFGIDNIHAMRESFSRLRDYLDTHGSTSSDGMSSFLRNGGWSWGGGNLSSMSASVSTLGDSGWLNHVQSVLAGAAWIAARIAMESASVLVHCSDGWDRTTQLVSLASLLLDPYYRTFKGFQALVEKDWLAFGHPFSDRLGIPTSFGTSFSHLELPRQSSAGSLPRTPSVGGSSHSQAANNCSPIFLQWVDCVSQLLRVYPCAFEFSSAFLVDFLDCVLSCRFGNFLCNSEKERQQSGIVEACGCIWMYLAHLRASEDGFHVHYNAFYDPTKHNGALLPPAASLAPTLWPQFHLRWACPLEAQAGELESQWRFMRKSCTEMMKAKDLADIKAKDLKNKLESLVLEMQKEKQSGISAAATVRRVYRENLAIKKAIQSLGCEVHFSSNRSHPFDSGNIVPETIEGLTSPLGGDLSDAKDLTDNDDLCVSIVAKDEHLVSDKPISTVCETLCPYRTREGCKWPDALCAQFGSQFVGITANFDAFDRLSIRDYYFGSE